MRGRRRWIARTDAFISDGESSATGSDISADPARAALDHDDSNDRHRRRGSDLERMHSSRPESVRDDLENGLHRSTGAGVPHGGVQAGLTHGKFCDDLQDRESEVVSRQAGLRDGYHTDGLPQAGLESIPEQHRPEIGFRGDGGAHYDDDTLTDEEEPRLCFAARSPTGAARMVEWSSPSTSTNRTEKNNDHDRWINIAKTPHNLTENEDATTGNSVGTGRVYARDEHMSGYHTPGRGVTIEAIEGPGPGEVSSEARSPARSLLSAMYSAWGNERT